MDQRQDIKGRVRQFRDEAKQLFPVKKVLLYGSHAKGSARTDSDIDVAVVVDLPDHHNRIDITTALFHCAGQVDVCIETKCIFWDEYQNCEQGSILSEIKRAAIEIT